MQVVYARETFPNSFSKSIFLAGPTPRSSEVESWRPEALECLESLNYDGVVFVPEDRKGAAKFDYMDQVEWEEQGLKMADSIVFWVPRELETMPGFTTNIEWGVWQSSGKAVLGSPKGAPKMRYLSYYAEKNQISEFTTLTETIEKAIDLIGEGDLRIAGEREVPMLIWRQSQFQRWYQSLRRAGNRLDGATYHWHTKIQENGFVFCHVIQPKIFVTNEGRHKSEEVVISRPDISSVLAYKRGETIQDFEVVLVKEFRSNATTCDGMVLELPGGSSTRPDIAADEIAAEELFEETGIRIDCERLVAHGSRQCMATLISHKGSLFSVELTEDEMDLFKNNQGKVFGDGEAERTYVQVEKVGAILNSPEMDWVHLGMILGGLGELTTSQVGPAD